MKILTKEEMYQQLRQLPKEKLPELRWELDIESGWPEVLGEKAGVIPKDVKKWCIGIIHDNIGLKACLRYAYVTQGEMTDQMFEDLWDSRKEWFQKVYEVEDSVPQGPGEESAAESGKNSNRPIMTHLHPFLFGCLGGLLFQLLKFILQKL